MPSTAPDRFSLLFGDRRGSVHPGAPQPVAHADLRPGDRVQAVWFIVDCGLRLWPVDASAGLWRLMRVDGPGPGEHVELDRAHLSDLQAAHPDATCCVNDNETVPPGTWGTVTEAGPKPTVHWDNGHQLALNAADQVTR